MIKKKVFVILLLVCVLLLASVVIDAATGPKKPSKYKGLKLGVKFDPNAKKSPCADFGCSPWHTVVGDKDAKKAYRCGCFIPKTLKKDKVVCFMSVGAAKKAGYKEEKCRR